MAASLKSFFFVCSPLVIARIGTELQSPETIAFLVLWLLFIGCVTAVFIRPGLFNSLKLIRLGDPFHMPYCRQTQGREKKEQLQSVSRNCCLPLAQSQLTASQVFLKHSLPCHGQGAVFPMVLMLCPSLSRVQLL